MFFSSSKKKEQNNSAVLHCQSFGQMFSPMGTGVEAHVLSPRKCSTNYWHSHQALKIRVYFLDLLQTQSPEGQIFKNPAAEQRSSPQAQVCKQLFFKCYEE
jgi:hypothetical protein